MRFAHLKHIIIVVLFPCCMIAQETKTYHNLRVLDAESKISLIGATALNLDTGDGAIADENGNIQILKTNQNSIISFSYLGYFERNYTMNNLPENVFLEKKTQALDEITISAVRHPQALTTSSETITDFVFDKDKIIMLTKPKGQDFVLKLTELNGNVILTQNLPEIKQIQELYTSCFGTHYLLAEFEVLQLEANDKEILTVERAPRKDFDKFIKPCITKNSEYVYFEHSRFRNQIAQIYAFHIESDDYFVFGTVQDDNNLKRLPGEEAYMRFIEGTGPIYYGIHARDPRDAIQWGEMLKRHFYTPVDYFMISQENTVAIFDHEKLRLKTFNLKGNLLRENPIDYPTLKGWNNKDNMYVDPVTGILYAVHRIGSEKHFTEIDINTGKRKNRYSIEAPHIENMAVYNGTLYFTNSSTVPGKGSRILKRVEL